MANIKVENLSITLNGRKILDNINLDIKEGQSFAIMGGSGCGKSVLIKSIIGLLKPDAGSQVTINGQVYKQESINQRGDFLKNFGMLFQGGALFDSMTIWENISFEPANLRKLTRKDAKALALLKLKQVGLEESVMYKYPKELSGGMQKRAALARAIANDPKIIFFDEPTAGLDPVMAHKISQLIRKLSKEMKATTVTITHDINCVKIIADKVAMIKDGQIYWQGASLDKVRDKYVREFIAPED